MAPSVPRNLKLVVVMVAGSRRHFEDTVDRAWPCSSFGALLLLTQEPGEFLSAMWAWAGSGAPWNSGKTRSRGNAMETRGDARGTKAHSQLRFLTHPSHRKFSQLKSIEGLLC